MMLSEKLQYTTLTAEVLDASSSIPVGGACDEQ